MTTTITPPSTNTPGFCLIWLGKLRVAMVREEWAECAAKAVEEEAKQRELFRRIEAGEKF